MTVILLKNVPVAGRRNALGRIMTVTRILMNQSRRRIAGINRRRTTTRMRTLNRRRKVLRKGSERGSQGDVIVQSQNAQKKQSQRTRTNDRAQSQSQSHLPKRRQPPRSLQNAKNRLLQFYTRYPPEAPSSIVQSGKSAWR